MDQLFHAENQGQHQQRLLTILRQYGKDIMQKNEDNKFKLHFGKNCYVRTLKTWTLSQIILDRSNQGERDGLEKYHEGEKS